MGQHIRRIAAVVRSVVVSCRAVRAWSQPGDSQKALYARCRAEATSGSPSGGYWDVVDFESEASISKIWGRVLRRNGGRCCSGCRSRAVKLVRRRVSSGCSGGEAGEAVSDGGSDRGDAMYGESGVESGVLCCEGELACGCVPLGGGGGGPVT